MRRALRAGCVALVSLTMLPACSSSRGSDTDTCSSSTTAVSLSTGRTGVVQVYSHAHKGESKSPTAFVRLDASSGRTVATCSGAVAVAAVDLGDHVSANPRALAAAGRPANLLPDLGTDYNLTAGTTARGVVDWRKGTRSALTFDGWRVVSVTAGGLLLQSTRADTSTRSSKAPSFFCLLPSVGAPRSACRPVAGARGPGFPFVHSDGTVGWVSWNPVPARFGTLSGWALTDGRVVAGFAPDKAQLLALDSSIGTFDASLDGRALLYVPPDSVETGTVQWFTVGRVDDAGVHGTQHASTIPQARIALTDQMGFSVSADGHTLHVLTASRAHPVSLWTVREGTGAATKVTLPKIVADAAESGNDQLVYWPT